MIRCSATTRIYIGKSIEPLGRFQGHLNFADGGTPASFLPLYNAIRSFGKETFTLEILEECESEVAAYVSERKWIQHFKALQVPLFNLNEGGKGSFSPVESTRQKIGDANRGKVLSPETRRKISEKLTGRVIPRDIVEKIAVLGRGRKLSPQACQNISKGKKASITPEYRQAVSDRMRGKRHPPETLKKIAEANRTYTDEQALAVFDDKTSGKLSTVELLQKHKVSTGTMYRMIARAKELKSK